MLFAIKRARRALKLNFRWQHVVGIWYAAMHRRYLHNPIRIFAEDIGIMSRQNVFAFPLQVPQTSHRVGHVIQKARRDLLLDIDSNVHRCVAANDGGSRLRSQVLRLPCTPIARA